MGAPETVIDELPPSDALLALADAYGISTSYWSFFGEHVNVPASTLRALLGAMGVDASDEDAALRARRERPWIRVVPDSLVVRQGTGELVVHLAEGQQVQLQLVLEDGAERDLALPDDAAETQTVAGVARRRLIVRLPPDLPLGWHTIRAEVSAEDGSRRPRVTTCSLIVTPHRLEAPPSREANKGRAWGLMAQLYSVRSRSSWGMGDFADLAGLASVAGAQGADFLLINPIHAAEVVAPIEPSPYLPASRRFIAPLYVQPERIPEAAGLAPADQALLQSLKAPLAALDDTDDLIDRDTVWVAKRAALETIFGAGLAADRRASLDVFIAREGRALQDFALWCALEEHFAGIPQADRPDGWHDLGSPLIAALREQLAERVDFHVWLQWIADAQLADAQAAALDAGMRIGVMHDLAVGVHPLGADVWSHPETYASWVTVGAPPDMYNQQGQDGRSRRGCRTPSPHRGTGRCGICCGDSCSTPARCAWTTSSACSGCGGSPPVPDPPRAPTSATTTRR